MGHVDLELPEAVHEHVKKLAKKGGVTINQLISSALAEKLSVLEAEPYFKARAMRANRKAYDAILANAPARKPLKGDALPKRK